MAIPITNLSEKRNEAYPIHPHYHDTKEAVKNFIEALPKVLKEHVLKVGDTINVPYEYPLLGLLSCASICIGKDVVLLDGTRKIYANIYIIIIGEQGLGKSPSIELMIVPLREKDKAFLEQFMNVKDELLTEKKQAKNKEERQEIEEQIRSLKKQKNIVDDETIENLAIRMLNSPKGLLWSTDELATLLKKQHNGSGVEDYLIKAYANAPWEIGRKSADEDIDIPFTYLSTVTTTQPKTAEKILLKPELQGNGFIARHLISVILPDDERSPELKKYKITATDEERYNSFMLKLYEKSKTLEATIVLSQEAEEYLEYLEYYHQTQRQEEPSGVFKGFHGKIGERVRKVALILHMLQQAEILIKNLPISKEISKEVIDVAYELVKHLTIDSLEKLFSRTSATEEDKMLETLIKMNKDLKVGQILNADNELQYVVKFDELFQRVKRRFKNNRESLRENLKNCPNLGVLKKIQMQAKNNRWYTTEVFAISSDIKEIYEAD